MSIENEEKTKGEQGFTACPDWGKGGHFVVDPETGLRVRVSVQPADPSAPAETVGQESETKKATKEKSRG